MHGEIAAFELSLFDEFTASYKAINSLAPEAVKAFDQFLVALDNFFDLCQELTNYKMENAIIKWYSSAVISSGNTIRAISNWYHQAAFDNISINMDIDDADNYVTYNGMCFGKVTF
jgi:hypothetical protein